MMRRPSVFSRKYSACVLLITLLLSPLLQPTAVRSQSTSPVSYTFEECDQVAEASLRDELNRITQAVFAEEQGGIDLAAIVRSNWESLDLDSIVDRRVADATEQIGDEEGLWGRIISGWSPQKAKELTKEIATLTFGSSTFRDAIDELSLDISADVVTEIRLMTARSASSALLCVQQYIGDTVSPTMAAVLEKDIQARLTEIEFTEDEDLDLLDVVRANPNLTGGVAVIIGTQIARTLGKQLAQTIAGRVVGRMLPRLVTGAIPLVGWVIGAGLIVWDLFNAKEGSLPQIRDALQAPEVKDEIRAQVLEKVGDELRVELPQLARSVSNDVYSQWQEFRQRYARILELAKVNMVFQRILDNAPIEEVKKLGDLVEELESKYGSDRFRDLVDGGQFERLFALPEIILEMIQLDVDPEEVIAWADLAGDSITRAIELEMYRVSSPEDFIDRADLERIIALEDVELVQKVMLLARDEREALLGLSSAHISQILNSLPEVDLSWLAKKYLAVLDPQQKNVLVERILRVPELFAELKVDSVNKALMESQDLEATLSYIIQKTKDVPWLGKVTQMVADIGPYLSGDLSSALFWRYGGTALLNVVYVLAGLIALLVVWWRVAPRRRQDVNVSVVLPERHDRDEKNAIVRRTERRSNEEDRP